MRKKIVTMIVAALLLTAISVVEQIAVGRLTAQALEHTGEILKLIRRGELAQGLDAAKNLDGLWDEKATRLELIIDHSGTDEVRYALSRLIAALEAEDRATAMVYASELEGGVEHVLERQELSWQNLL